MKAILVFIFIGSSFLSFAQIPDYFGQNQEWLSTRTDFSGYPYHIYQSFRHHVKGQYMHNAKTYYRIMVDEHYEYYNTVFNQLEVAYSSRYQSHLFRQVGRKVFTVNYQGNDTLWIDYGAEVGDTLLGFFNSYASFTNGPITVKKIDSVEINNIYYRVLVTDTLLDSSPVYNHLIEGVGFLADSNINSGAFDYYIPREGEQPRTLDCYSINDSTVWKSTSFTECDYSVFVSGTDINENKIGLSIYPNPITTRVNIEASIPIKSIELYTINGQKIKRKDLLDQLYYSVDVSMLSLGIYIIKVILNGGQILTRKLIKE